MKNFTNSEPIWPFRIYILYLVLIYSGITDFVPFIGLIRPGLLSVVLLTLFWSFSSEKRTDVTEPEVIALIFMIFFTAFSALYSANFGITKWYLEAEILDFFGLVMGGIYAVKKIDHLKFFLLLWIFLGLLISIQVIASGGLGPERLGDENDVTISILMTLPFSYFGISFYSGRMKYLCILTFGLSLIAIVEAGSRGGFLATLAVFIGIWIYSNRKILILSLALITVMGGGLIIMPQNYLDDMSTISDTKESTADERLYSWGLGFKIFLDNPILGVGAAQYGWNVQKYQFERGDLELDDDGKKIRRDLTGRTSHSTYVDFLAERGLVGLILMFFLFKSIYRRLKKGRGSGNFIETEGHENELSFFAYSTSCAVMGYLVGSLFVTTMYFPNFWLFVGLIVAVSRLNNKSLPSA